MSDAFPHMPNAHIYTRALAPGQAAALPCRRFCRRHRATQPAAARSLRRSARSHRRPPVSDGNRPRQTRQTTNNRNMGLGRFSADGCKTRRHAGAAGRRVQDKYFGLLEESWAAITWILARISSLVK
eukprot:3501499-Rhodomonas_salina.1